MEGSAVLGAGIRSWRTKATACAGSGLELPWPPLRLPHILAPRSHPPKMLPPKAFNLAVSSRRGV